MKPLFLGIGIAIVLFLLPVFSFQDPMATQLDIRLQSPSVTHWLGTDHLGRDVWGRTLYGTRTSLGMAFLSCFLSVSGGLFGASVMVWNRRGRIVGMSLINTLLAIPGFLLSLVLITLLGQSYGTIAIAVGIAQIPLFARLATLLFMRADQEDYVLASKALGADWRHLFRWHLLTYARPSLIKATVTIFSFSLMQTSALSALGLGGDPSYPSWGIMLADGRNYFRLAPWIALVPGIALSLTIGLAQYWASLQQD